MKLGGLIVPEKMCFVVFFFQNRLWILFLNLELDY